MSHPLSVILKLVGERCNIDCHYCYEKRKPQNEGAFLSAATLSNFLIQCAGQPLSIELHGGEPLLLSKKKMAPLFEELTRYPSQVQIRMQTNGTLIDEEWLQFFKTHWPSLELGISLDGDTSSNSLRNDYKGRSTSLKVEKALHLLNEYGWEIGIIAVITKNNLGRAAENLEYYKNFSCIKVIKFAPCFDFSIQQAEGPKRSKLTMAMEQKLVMNDKAIWAITPNEYTDYLIDTWKIWKKNSLYHYFSLEPHLSIIRKLSGKSTSNCHFSKEKCHNVITLYPDGRITSCDELPLDLSLIQGKTTTYLSHVQGMPPTLKSNYLEVMKKCETCSYQKICAGGCIATRLRYKNTPYYEEYCNHRIKIINFIQQEI